MSLNKITLLCKKYPGTLIISAGSLIIGVYVLRHGIEDSSSIAMGIAAGTSFLARKVYKAESLNYNTTRKIIEREGFLPELLREGETNHSARIYAEESGRMREYHIAAQTINADLN